MPVWYATAAAYNLGDSIHIATPLSRRKARVIAIKPGAVLLLIPA